MPAMVAISQAGRPDASWVDASSGASAGEALSAVLGEVTAASSLLAADSLAAGWAAGSLAAGPSSEATSTAALTVTSPSGSVPFTS